MTYFTLLIYGFLAAAAALLLEVMAGSFTSSLSAVTPSVAFVLIAAFIEEGSKFVFFRQFARRFHKELEFPNGFLLGLLFGLGFSLVEFGLIFSGFKAWALFPVLSIVALHLLTSLFFAFYLFRPVPGTRFHTLSLLGGMVAIHAAFNLFVLL